MANPSIPQIYDREMNRLAYLENAMSVWGAMYGVVVQDKETIAALSRQNAAIMGNPEADPFYGAPTVLIVLADKSRPTYLYDGSCVMDNLLNAAQAVGLGACWIHRAKEEFESEEGKALLKQWGIQGDYEGIGHCVLGYRADAIPAPAPRKENYVYYVR